MSQAFGFGDPSGSRNQNAMGMESWLDNSQPRRSRSLLTKSRPRSAKVQPIVGTKEVLYATATDQAFDYMLCRETHRPIDVRLELKSLGSGRRARIYIESEREIKLVISRVVADDEFFLQITALASSAPIIVYLPSNFHGAVDVGPNPIPRPSFSSALKNRMAQQHLPDAHRDGIYLINTERFPNNVNEDELQIRAQGSNRRIILRMWDVRTDSAERQIWETVKWLFRR